MRLTKRLIMFVLVLAMAASLLALPVMANSSDTQFSFSTSSGGTFSKAATGRLKENSTPVYVYQTGGSSSIRVQARGATSQSGTYYYGYYDNSGNFHYYTVSAGGTGLYYVTCNKGTQYSIHTNIWEHLKRDSGYTAYAAPYMCTSFSGGYGSGLWSPDSANTWNEAIY